MQVLIIEDEARAARQLQKLLASCGFSYELVGTIDTVEETVEWFRTNPSPDLVFMDIQLADGLSFEIFQSVTVEAPIIFTTAFDQYAIQAFKVNSVDYLLKPVQKDDLSLALDKFTRSNKPQSLDPQILKQLLGSVQAQESRSGILVKDGDGFVQILITDLLYAYSEESVTFGVTQARRFIVDETIDQLYQSLDPLSFYRINRAQIVAKSAITKIDRYFNHRLKLSVLNPRDQEFIVSRPKTTDFKDWMNR
ncbi:LytR/AlgR family response regulator transcription factor [Poritiphilus flavus]|uniref:Response regulator n=1 Tax=Poritiphilus flavus TaxID=2697053 RepID=A0A6L9EFD6_9FLAO|nr:LytTR family DNA-binding domain-containing protein [Poritiphilus flavus]NAS13292.1 response regulator [Poritiphilus flavus]